MRETEGVRETATSGSQLGSKRRIAKMESARVDSDLDLVRISPAALHAGKDGAWVKRAARCEERRRREGVLREKRVDLALLEEGSVRHGFKVWSGANSKARRCGDASAIVLVPMTEEHRFGVALGRARAVEAAKACVWVAELMLSTASQRLAGQSSRVRETTRVKLMKVEVRGRD